MTDSQWRTLQRVIDGEALTPLPYGFIIDCPWLPGWYGVSKVDYFSNDEIWLKANLKALQEFPECMFFPGFWSEYGMCTEPSAFGSKGVFPAHEFPHAHRVILDPSQIASLDEPNPATDGLLPFMLNRLKLAQPYIEEAGHRIRFAVARGPLNICSFLMGTTEFLTAMLMHPDETHRLLRRVTNFTKNWIELQATTFPSIEGIMLLDDIVGFIDEEQFLEFGMPYLKELYSPRVPVKLFHNDASCEMSVHHYPDVGINVYNMAFDTDLNSLKERTGNRMVMLGNIPPRDVLAAGTPHDVREAVRALRAHLASPDRVIFSCGGGMPPGVSSANIQAFIEALA